MHQFSRGCLYLLPMPIAEGMYQEVLPLYTQRVVHGVDYFLVENAKKARKYLKQLNHPQAISTLQVIELDKHKPQGAADVAQLMQPLHQGRDIGVLSEAGCPGIADPGSILVAYAHAHQLPVMPLVGPCSIFLALMGSGLNGQQFAFHGYLPIEGDGHKVAIQRLERIALQTGQTQIFIETPYRNQRLLHALVQLVRPTMRLCIACNLTAADGWIRTKQVKDWQRELPNLAKLPVVFLLAP